VNALSKQHRHAQGAWRLDEKLYYFGVYKEPPSTRKARLGLALY
jgi:hypothetical protein